MVKSSIGGVKMKGFVQNTESIAVKNKDFRRVFYTANRRQLVVMAAKPKEEIGTEYQAWRSQTPSMKAR
jgi:hypothetical protein